MSRATGWPSAGHVDSHVLTAAAATADAATDPADSLRIADDALRRWRGTPYDGVPDTGWLEPVRSRLAEVRVDVAAAPPRRPARHRPPRPCRRGPGPADRRAPLPRVAVGAEVAGALRLGPPAGGARGVPRAAPDARRRTRCRAGAGTAPAARADPRPRPDAGLRPRPRRRSSRPRRGRRGAPAPARHPVRRPRRRAPRPRRPARGEPDRHARRSRWLRQDPARGRGRRRRVRPVPGRGVVRGPVLGRRQRRRPCRPGRRRLAATLGLDPGARRTAFDTLRDVLADRAVLLVLDNCEQVVDGAAATVEALVDVAPAVTVLATSRQPLGVDGETVDTLDPLALPVGDEPAALAASPAVTLFRERVTARGEPVALDGPDGAAIARICVAVDGLPLGIELAAARIGTFTLREIADGLGRDPGSLSRLGRGPSRQQNLHAEVDWSYRLATPEERIAHRRLAVLPRPFTLDAAEAVCGMAPLRRGPALDLVGSPGWRPRPGSATTGSSGPGSPRPRPRSASAPATPTSCSPPAPSAQPPTSSSATARRRRWRRRRRSSPRTRPSATTSPHCSPQRPSASPPASPATPTADCAGPRSSCTARRRWATTTSATCWSSAAAISPRQDAPTTPCAPSRRRQPASAASAGGGRAPTGPQSCSTGYATGWEPPASRSPGGPGRTSTSPSSSLS